MEMDFLHRAAMNLGFRFGNSQEYFFGFGNDLFREIGMVQYFFYVMQVPVFMVMMVCMVLMMMFLVMIVFVVMMMATTARFFFMNKFMVMAVSNTVSVHPGVVMFMIMVMFVLMIIIVVMCMVMFMHVVTIMCMFMFVFLFFRQDNIKILRLNPGFVHAFMNQFIVSQMKLGKFFLQERKWYASIQQRAQ